jgi:hypothetical protein
MRADRSPRWTRSARSCRCRCPPPPRRAPPPCRWSRCRTPRACRPARGSETADRQQTDTTCHAEEREERGENRGQTVRHINHHPPPDHCRDSPRSVLTQLICSSAAAAAHLDCGDEELASVRVGAAVRHRQETCMSTQRTAQHRIVENQNHGAVEYRTGEC